jgi:hypothetical protein
MPAAGGDRWRVDETEVKVAGQWRSGDPAIDQFGQVIDVFVSARGDADAADRCFKQAIDSTRVRPVEVNRSGPGRPGGAGGAAAGGMASQRPGRQERRRGRPRPVEGATGAGAWAQPGPACRGRHRRAGVGAERSARTRRAGRRRAGDPATGRRVRRTGLDHLLPGGSRRSTCPESTQCNSTHFTCRATAAVSRPPPSTAGRSG